MASHKTAHGTVWYDPVRSDHGGQRLRIWLDAPLQAALRHLAAERGCTLPQAARLVLDAWLAEQTREVATTGCMVCDVDYAAANWYHARWPHD